MINKYPRYHSNCKEKNTLPLFGTHQSLRLDAADTGRFYLQSAFFLPARKLQTQNPVNRDSHRPSLLFVRPFCVLFVEAFRICVHYTRFAPVCQGFFRKKCEKYPKCENALVLSVCEKHFRHIVLTEYTKERGALFPAFSQKNEKRKNTSIFGKRGLTNRRKSDILIGG